MSKILVVEDLAPLRQLLKAQLVSHQFEVDEAGTFETAAQKIKTGKYDVIVLDLRLPDGSSLRLFDNYPREMNHKTIIITANPTVPTVVEAIKKGAFNYLEKPIEEELLIAQVKKIIQLNRLENQYQSIKTEVTADYVFENIVYESRQMDEIIARAKVLANTDNTILIQGETGVGKEVLSNSIHNYSRRNSETFLPINCAS
ncbi:MAG: sigma-54-dependent Fis family transcriptional regulator, partial [bacterium]|nr:sigma-54-dependent Fis family transcriptional regulator [bacterium]